MKVDKERPLAKSVVTIQQDARSEHVGPAVLRYLYSQLDTPKTLDDIGGHFGFSKTRRSVFVPFLSDFVQRGVLMKSRVGEKEFYHLSCGFRNMVEEEFTIQENSPHEKGRRFMDVPQQ